MRKEYGKALRAHFTRRMKEALPQFAPARITSVYLNRGERVFCWRASESVFGWIILSPSATGHQAFTVEVGWSSLGRFPELSMRPSVMGAAEVDLMSPPAEGALRVGTVSGNRERWWQLPDPALENPGSLTALAASLDPLTSSAAQAAVAPHVEDAMAELVDHAVPFLESLIAAIGTGR